MGNEQRPDHPGSTPTILLVEDEQIVAADIHQRLISLGYAVPAIVSSGEEALSKAEEIHPDLMLVDIVLQGPLDGVETVRLIHLTMPIPVIYLTAHTDAETVQRAKLTEPLGYLLKPFDERELRFSIEMGLHRHRVDSALRETEEHYRLMAENIRDLISRHRPDGTYLYASPASFPLLGYTPEELLGRCAYDFFHPDDARRIRELDAAKAQLFSAGTESYRIARSDGSYIWFETTVKSIHDPLTGRVEEILAVSRDITERKRAEGILRRYEFIANAAKEFMTLIDRAYVYEAANEAYCRAHQRSRTEIVGHTVADVWGTDTFNNIIKGYLDQSFAGKDVHYESWFQFGNEGSLFFDVHYYPYYNEHGEVTHCVVVSHDITKRKTAEDLLQTSLKEKEVLLKEIHHRVKNNLQVISSLLNLQWSTIDNQEARELVRESQNRVRSMALIHERLYQSESLARIDFDDYLRSLTRELFRSYSAGGISLKMEGENTHLDVDTAIPCGLIVNELVSNALKHAFPDGRKGLIQIKFWSVGHNKYAIAVGDNGIGLPPDLDIQKTKTLGLQLVNMLVRQLHGTLDVVTEGGTTVMVTFASER